jgi:signal transduction histidine kinase
MKAPDTKQDSLANTGTTPVPHKSMRRWLWYSLLGVLLFNTLSILDRLLFGSDATTDLKTFADINNALGLLLGTAFCVSRLPYFWQKKDTRAADISTLHIAQVRIPLCIAAVFLVSALERCAYIYYDIVHTEPAIDWPLVIVLLRYPFLLIALISLYRRYLTIVKRLRLVFDGFLILTALITFSWYFLLGPIILEGHQSIFAKMVTIAYPLADLILCFYLSQLFFRSTEPALHLVRPLLLWGLLSIIIADFFDISHLVQAHPLWPLLQSLMLCLGYILIALATQALHHIIPEKIEQNTRAASLDKQTQVGEVFGPPTRSLFLWQSLLPTICVPAVLLFMVIIWSAGGTGPLALGVTIAGIALIVQLVLRQLLVMYETFISNRILQQMQKELHAKNTALTEANSSLEERTEELKRAYEQQRQANELKDQFLLNVNHELRTPLTEMLGYLELLRLHSIQGKLNVAVYDTFLSHALNGSQELLRLVDTILDTLRSEHARQALHLETVLVIAVVQEVVESFDPRKRAPFELHLAIPAELKVPVDRQYLTQVLTNLLSNAFKYSSAQTVIEIGAQKIVTDEPTANEEAQIWVRDYGPGVPPEDIEFLFDKFFRLTRHQTSSIRGTGLGLYVCKKLVEAMDGRIWVESSGVPGEGSRFCFALPVSQTKIKTAGQP